MSVWPMKYWEEVLQVKNGKNQKEVENPNGKFPIYGSGGNVMNYSNEFICDEGTIIIGRKGTIDNPLFINHKFWIVDTAFGITGGKELDRKFLYYFCLGLDFRALNKGTTIPSLVKTDLLKIKMPVPSLKEQKQIVAILDEAFEAIDKAKANIEKNIENAKELFQAKLNQIFSNKSVGWNIGKLGQMCSISMGQSPDGKSYNSSGIGTPLINGPVEFGEFPFSETVMTKWTTAPTKMCRKGDLILCVRGSTTGRINLAGFDACIGRGVASIRYEKNQSWLNFFIRSKQKAIYDLGTGATFPNVSGKILEDFDFIEPPIEIQKSLVDTMIKLESNTNALLERYEWKISRLLDLKKSILQKAFAGELINAKKELEKA